MGFELYAFLGKASELREWKGELPSIVVCPLSGDLGLVPVTGELFEELRARLGREEADRLDATQQYSTYPSPSQEESVRLWGEYASRKATIAYVSASEFGDSSHESAVLWSNGKEIPFRGGIGAVLDYFRDRVGIHLEKEEIDLEKYRGETAGEKWAAATILHELVDRSEKPTFGLIEALRYERKSRSIQDLVRQFAAASLEELGPTAKEAVPALEQTLKSEQDLGICIAAASALAAIGPEAVPALRSALAGAVYDKQWPILHALGKLGPAAKQAVPVLMKVLQNEVLHDFLGVRSEAADTLGKIGLEAGAAVPALIEVLKDKEWTVRSHAAQALGEIGVAALASVPALIGALKDKEWTVRHAAAVALGEIGPYVWDVASARNDAQNEGDPWVRETFGRALTSWDVASALNDARKDDDQYVREAAGRALAKVRRKAAPAKAEQDDGPKESA